MSFVQLPLAMLMTIGLLSTVLGETKPFGNKLPVIPGKIEAEHFDLGKAAVAYYDVDEKNLGADYREPTQVDIEKRSDASNGHGLGWTNLNFL